MSAKSKGSSKFLLIGIIIAAVLVLGTTIYALSQKQVTQENAALPTFTSLEVTGSIYTDTNKNGQKDTGETNYTGKPLPKVQVTLLSQVCPPSSNPSGGPTTFPTPTVIQPPSSGPSPKVTPPPGCFYRSFCSQIACQAGHPCPTCSPTLVCPSGSPFPTPAITQRESGEISGGVFHASANDHHQNPQGSDQVASNAQQNDACRELPGRVINCSMSPDGTFLCGAQNVDPFTSASVSLMSSAFYKVTSDNPVIVKGSAATVNFGVTPSGIDNPQEGQGPSEQGITSGDKLPFTIHVTGLTTGVPVVMYISEGKENPDPAFSQVYTTNASGNIVIKATPNDQIFMIPLASKGYSTITPQRLQVTATRNSCGLVSPCMFVATPGK